MSFTVSEDLLGEIGVECVWGIRDVLKTCL